MKWGLSYEVLQSWSGTCGSTPVSTILWKSVRFVTNYKNIFSNNNNKLSKLKWRDEIISRFARLHSRRIELANTISCLNNSETQERDSMPSDAPPPPPHPQGILGVLIFASIQSFLLISYPDSYTEEIWVQSGMRLLSCHWIWNLRETHQGGDQYCQGRSW